MLFENHSVVGSNHAVYDGRTNHVEKQGDVVSNTEIDVSVMTKVVAALQEFIGHVPSTNEPKSIDPKKRAQHIAMMASDNGRHLAVMPHIERSIFQWNWPYYVEGRVDEVSPWHEAFVNARKWIENNV